jgi:hypothetical protein
MLDAPARKADFTSALMATLIIVHEQQPLLPGERLSNDGGEISLVDEKINWRLPVLTAVSMGARDLTALFL